MLIIFSILYKIPNKFLPIILRCYLFFFRFPKSKSDARSILFVNTHDQSGGASKICYSLFKHEISRGSKLVVGFKKKDNSSVYEVDNKNSISTKTLNFLSDYTKKGDWLDFDRIGFLKIKNKIQISNFSIIHLHNLHGGFFSYGIFSKFKQFKRVIWTLHDEHSITGHCSFTMQCERWKIGCGSCPSLGVYPAIRTDNTKQLLYWKKKWINQLNPIIVSPSQWLAERVKLSYPSLNDVRVINNGIDIDVFVPSNKLSIRQELNLPIDQFLVLFVAEFSTNNPFKGGEIVREIIGNNINKEICFVTIGSENKKMDRKHIEIPYISKDEELAKLYAACDVLFYPTNADNFPLVVLEAMGCGLPVIASAIAGIPEIIKDNYNGFLVEGYSGAKKYQDKLNYVYGLNKSEKFIQISQCARQTVENQFSLKQMLDNYLLLYQSLMKDGSK